MPTTYRKDALIIFFLLVFVFAYFYQDGGANANSRFDLIFASVQKDSFSINDYYNKADTATIDHAYYKGNYYSDKAIGPAVLGAAIYEPLFWLQNIFHHPNQTTVKMILTFLVIGLPSAIAGSFMYILCLYMSHNRFRAFLVTLSITLGTMFLPYSVAFFSHQLTSSLIFIAFVLIFFLKESKKIKANGYLFLIGLLLGWAFISEFPSAILILALAVYYISTIWKRPDYRHLRSIAFPLLGGLIPIILQMAYNKICFNNYFSIGYSNLDNQYFSASMNQGLMGILWPNLKALYYMTIHPALGILWQSPVLFLAILGAFFILRSRQYRAEGILSIWIIFSYFVVLSGYYMWWGGYALSSRFIIPALPFFCLLLIFIPNQLNWPFIGLSIVSIGQMVIAAASTVLVPDTMIANLSKLGYFGYSNIYNYCLKELLKGNFTQNLGQQLFHLKSWESLIPLFVLLVGFTLFFFREKIKLHNQQQPLQQ